MPALKITKASFSDDPAICFVAKQSPFTRDFTSHRFFRANIESDYAKGFVGVAKRGAVVAGFVYCKHLVRKPMSVIHYMGVDISFRGEGVGRKLLEWAGENTPWDQIELSCEHRNEGAMKFYERVGLKLLFGNGYYGTPPNERLYSRWLLDVGTWRTA